MELPEQEPSLSDIGTRLEHLRDYRDSLEVCIDILKERGLNSPTDKQRLVKFSIAEKVLRVTIDAYMGYKDARTEYVLNKMVDEIPVDPTKIEGGRGTPLA